MTRHMCSNGKFKKRMTQIHKPSLLHYDKTGYMSALVAGGWAEIKVNTWHMSKESTEKSELATRRLTSAKPTETPILLTLPFLLHFYPSFLRACKVGWIPHRSKMPPEGNPEGLIEYDSDNYQATIIAMIYS